MYYYPDPVGEGEGGRWVLGYSRFQVTEMIEGFLGVWNFWFCNFLRSENLGGLIKVGIFWVLKTVWIFLCVTVEPWYNKVPTDWQNLFAILRFCYIEVLFHMFYYYWGEENHLLHWGLRYIEVHYIEISRFHCIWFNYFWKFLSLGNSAWDFLGVNWSRDVLGFGSLPPFNHPRHLKSVVPPPPNWVVLLIGCAAWEICFNQSRSTTQIWVVMRYQYGISALFSQTSICGENQWWRRLISAVFSGYSNAQS